MGAARAFVDCVVAPCKSDRRDSVEILRFETSVDGINCSFNDDKLTVNY